MDILKCSKCGFEGISEFFANNSWCKNCGKEYNRQYYLKNIARFREYRLKNAEHIKESARELSYKNGGKPMSENKECSSFLGIHVAEHVLAHVFKDVERMPYGNPLFDFVCNKGKMVDVKSSCIHHWNKKSPLWQFTIRKNTGADYFLCIAFDDRDSLTPIHIWLLPGVEFNHKQTASIGITKIHKWDKYALDIEKVTECCDVLKGD